MIAGAMRAWAVATVLVCTAPSAWSQVSGYPNRTVTIVAPAAPGGLYSLFARLIGSKLEQRFGKSFVVENKPGASSIVGSLAVIRSPHDGYTLMVANTSGLAANVTLHKSLPYEPLKDFAPVSLISRVPEVLVVNAALPVVSLADLAQLAKATPGGLSFASAGAGTAQHLSGIELGAALGVPVTHVPYKGMQPAIADVAGGHIPFMFSPISFALPLAQAGKLRMLGVTTAERIEAVPDVPPLIEVGLKQFDAVSWFMLVAPAGTPADIVGKLHQEVRAVMADPEVHREFVKLGLAPVQSPPPEDLPGFVRSEIVVWGEIIRRAGLAGSQ
ncbi:Bug family tripartite tricarboxylate transporter substrate binding protein [Rhodoplanes sp. Z2-YC6860]|uniref:Bug family tripartite tricarboxylate transporter substrate binding protein n=1 Tax=Rhodoplanes sp. Z2-YC6860 TaxID=674703 RepID=UPI0008324A34|nr:tripartite tricarboxylate transporter substrate binding protein [Rhodoplanes sp. Z2-YC6860]